MRSSRKYANVLLPLLAAFLLLIGNGRATFAQATNGEHNPAPAPTLPPEHPLTRTQLATLFTRLGSIEAQRTFVHQTLELQRKKLPSWFPLAIWDEAEQKVSEIDQIAIALPFYQKYVSADTADGLILLYQGETGLALAQAWTRHAMASMTQGFRGGDAAQKAEQSMGEDSTAESLMRKRLNELTPEQRSECLNAAQSLNQIIVRINNEKNAAYMAKVRDIAHRVLDEHKAEIAAAEKQAKR